MSTTEIVFCCIAGIFLFSLSDLVRHLGRIAGTLKEIHDLLKANAPKQVKPADENVSTDELCRRFRIRLEQAQMQKTRR